MGTTRVVNNMVMYKANVVEVKAKLSSFIDRVAGGERILICRHNRPVAELGPVANARTTPRPVGPLPGRPTFDVPPSFFEPLSDDELDRWLQVAAGDPTSVAGAKSPSRRSSIARGREPGTSPTRRRQAPRRTR